MRTKPQKKRQRLIPFFSAFFSLFFLCLAMTPAYADCCSCVGADQQKVCITIDKGGCGSFKTQYNNPNLGGLNCTTSLSNAQCSTVSQGGICQQVFGAQTYGYIGSGNVVAAGTSTPIITPLLNVQIPGLSFPTSISQDGGSANIPFIAQYISAVYKYLVGISVIAAAVIIVYGGMLYIVSSSATSVQTGKDLIADAIIGLCLVFGAYVILATLNPQLVDFNALKIALIPKAFDNADAEAARVRAAASTPTQPPQNPVVPVIDATSGVPSSTQIAAEIAAASGTTPVPTQPPGTIAKDAQGNYIAQGACPVDMQAIVNSPKYDGKLKTHVDSFCMDTYEAPNQAGVVPFNGVTEWEADWYCQARGKRLCSSSEWTRACLGPDGVNTYMYGPTYIPGKYVSAGVPDTYSVIPGPTGQAAPCNYDTPTKGQLSGKIHALDGIERKPQDSALDPNNDLLTDPKTRQKVLDMQAGVANIAKGAIEPSGSRPGCVSAEGVHDLSGNVQEIMTTDAGSKMTTEQRVARGIDPGGKPYTWANYYWDPIAHLADTKATPTCTVRWGGPHAVGWRGYENGFRCCMNLAPPTPGQLAGQSPPTSLGQPFPTPPAAPTPPPAQTTGAGTNCAVNPPYKLPQIPCSSYESCKTLFCDAKDYTLNGTPDPATLVGFDSFPPTIGEQIRQDGLTFIPPPYCASKTGSCDQSKYLASTILGPSASGAMRNRMKGSMVFRPEARDALIKAGKTALAQGYFLAIGDGTRTMAVQAQNWCQRISDSGSPKGMATPGKSPHQQGVAVDIGLFKLDGTQVKQLTLIGTICQQVPIQTALGIDNLKTLESIMASAGFKHMCQEVWHFDYQGIYAIDCDSCNFPGQMQTRTDSDPTCKK